MSLGQLLQFNVMITALTFPVVSLGWIMSLIQQGISAMGGSTRSSTARWNGAGTGRGRETGMVSFEVQDLHFAYAGQTEAILKGVTLLVRAGSSSA